MRRLAALTAVLLGGGSLAHSEPVEVMAWLTPVPNAVRVEAELVGQTSGLPVRGATVEVQVTPRGSDVPAGDVLGRTRLTGGEGGQYAGSLAPLPAGRYVLTVVDTTYRGEAAVAARAFTLSSRPARVEVVLPATSTPRRYVAYALLGLLAPLLILGLVLGTRRLARQESG